MIKKLKNNIPQGYVSPFAIHPGETIKDEMEYLGMTQQSLADRTGISKKTINAIIAEKHPVTKDTAERLGKVFHSPAYFWLAIQKRYEADSIRLKKEEVLEKELSLLPNFRNAYNELIKATIFNEAFQWRKNNFNDIANQLQKFFGVASLQILTKQSIDGFAFRKYERQNTDAYALSAWLRLGKRKAQETETEYFDKAKLKEAIEQIKSLSNTSHKKYLPKIESILAECGVVVAYMPLFKNIHTQGATTWISPKKALIMINTHNRNEGQFWFTLFHEIGHLLSHSKKDQFINFDNIDKTSQEAQADEFAQKNLLPNYENMLNYFEASKKITDYKKLVKTIAENENVSIPVFAGRLTHEYRNTDKTIYQKLSSLLPAKINEENVTRLMKV